MVFEAFVKNGVTVRDVTRMDGGKVDWKMTPEGLIVVAPATSEASALALGVSL